MAQTRGPSTLPTEPGHVVILLHLYRSNVFLLNLDMRLSVSVKIQSIWLLLCAYLSGRFMGARRLHLGHRQAVDLRIAASRPMESSS